MTGRLYWPGDSTILGGVLRYLIAASHDKHRRRTYDSVDSWQYL